MVQAESGPKKKIRDKLCELLDAGSKVAAVKFYHDVTLAPLVESKKFIDSMQLDRNISFGDEKLNEFLVLLEERDFGGAAARLFDELPGSYLPSEVIDHALHVAKLLDIDISQMELPPSSQTTLSQVRTAQSIIYVRAELRIRKRMVESMVKKGTNPEEAETMVDEAFQWLQVRKYVRPDLDGIEFTGLDPEVERVVRLLLGPVPQETKASPTPKSEVGLLVGRPGSNGQLSADESRALWFRRLGRLASVVYALFALAGLLLLGYSYSNIPPLKNFSMVEGLSLTEQQTQIDEWLNDNTASSLTWFLDSMSRHHSPVALEPDLPLAYAGENWTWEKKLASVNVSASEIDARLKRCHEALFFFYSIALVLACFYWFRRDIVSGLLMVLLGVLGVPFLTAQAWRTEFENPLWLGPLLIPASIALLASILDLALVTPKTNRRKDLQGFWWGASLFAVSGVFLAWTIHDGNHLRPGAGLGIFGGALLMLRHGWRTIRFKD